MDKIVTVYSEVRLSKVHTASQTGGPLNRRVKEIAAVGCQARRVAKVEAATPRHLRPHETLVS